MVTSAKAAADTLSLLEERLRRVDYVLNGHPEHKAEQLPATQHGAPAAARLRALERTLRSLTAKSVTASEVHTLQKKHPELFHSGTASAAPSTLSAASLPSLVLAHSQLYHTISARLSQLQDTSVPDPAAASKLVELQPRIERARVRQEVQVNEFAELRARSARVVETWYGSGVLGMGERWAEWEERLRDAEILVRRREAARKREEGMT